MKSKLLAVFAIVLFSGLFSACSEEDITPIDKQKGSATGVGQDDKGF